jgi:REP element-mobilizing transposase RayT
MVAGFHLIWTAYGWWLPNDPRGSTSHEIRVEKIAETGELHFGRKPVQPSGAEIKLFYEQAREVLKHPLLTLSDQEIDLAGTGLARAIAERRYTCYACAIMPDHVHVLIRKHRDRAETMIEQLQAASREELIRAGKRAATHPVWTRKGWFPFLYTRQDFERVIEYIRRNPIVAGRAAQEWEFVKKYDGWLPGRWSG